MSKFSRHKSDRQVSKGQEYEINTLDELAAYYESQMGVVSLVKLFSSITPTLNITVVGDMYWLSSRDGTLTYDAIRDVIDGLHAFYDKVNPVLFDELAAIQAGREDARAQLRAPLPRQTYPGFVYLIRSVTGYYKIGKTYDPDDRIKTFGVKLPFEVEYEWLIKTDDMSGLERSLHERFAAQRVNGEWFSLSADDVAYIKSLGGES